MGKNKEKLAIEIKTRLKLSYFWVLSSLGDEKARAILHIERESRKKTKNPKTEKLN